MQQPTDPPALVMQAQGERAIEISNQQHRFGAHLVGVHRDRYFL
jgi:hypothetical protein